jgi:hypothetical protein
MPVSRTRPPRATAMINRQDARGHQALFTSAFGSMIL